MANKRRRGPSILAFPALLLSTVTHLTTSCSTLEIGFESSTPLPAAGAPVETVADVPAVAPKTPTPVPDDYVSPTPEPAFTPVPVEAYPAPAGLRVAFVKDGAVWLWAAGEASAVPLTTADEVYGGIEISDDGTTVAFIRGAELWAIDSDGTGERRLVSTADLSTMETETKPDDRGARLNRFAWIPGTHVVAFNTRQPISEKTILNHDLHLVDADTLEQTVLLAPSEGGEFTYSIDGSQVAIVTPGDVSLIDADGGNRRDSVLTYAPVEMYSASDYYAQPAWSADGDSLLVAITPADPQVRPIQHTTIWRIPIDGDPAELVTTIDALPIEDAVSFSHDLNYMAYGEVQQAEGSAPEQVEIWLKVVRLANGDWFAYPDVSALYGWAPDSRRFAFVAGHQTSQLQIRQWSAPAIPSPIDAGVPVRDVRWVDTSHYLFVARRNWEMGAEGDSFDLILGDTDGASTALASTADYLVYDFTPAGSTGSVPTVSTNRPTSTPRAPMATPAPTATPGIEGVATPHCRPSDASVSLTASATTLAVGQVVSITVTLTNGDASDARLGQVRYHLGVQPSHVLTSDDLGPVVHTRSLDPGESDAIVFVLRAAAPGRATLTGSTDFEMHALDTSWGSWSSCDSRPLDIVVTPSTDTNTVIIHQTGDNPQGV